MLNIYLVQKVQYFMFGQESVSHSRMGFLLAALLNFVLPRKYIRKCHIKFVNSGASNWGYFFTWSYITREILTSFTEKNGRCEVRAFTSCKCYTSSRKRDHSLPLDLMDFLKHEIPHFGFGRILLIQRFRAFVLLLETGSIRSTW